jgi:desulfoferrodoxin (superoxide reductase-like protein)
VKKPMLVFACCMSFALFYPKALLANKPAVSIEAPSTAEKGSEARIRIVVTHQGNSFMHYTEWARLDVDGKTVGKWEFTRSNRPEDATFTREVKVKVSKTIEVVSEASCNVHGSAGPIKATITVGD